MNAVENTKYKNIIAVISGRGSNMSALLDSGVNITTVLSNVSDAPGLSIAEDRGIKCIVCSTVNDICDTIESISPDLVCLAGFTKILPQSITDKFKIMNIHPSLLPHFPGLHAQKQALESGASYTGCTVHMVDGGIDTGKIIVQKAVPIFQDDTIERLSARVLKYEHKMYAKAINILMHAQTKSSDKLDRTIESIDAVMKYASKSQVSYAWRNNIGLQNDDENQSDDYFIVVSNKPPEIEPYIVITQKDDTPEIVETRLKRLFI